jgi:hypothetical protein
MENPFQVVSLVDAPYFTDRVKELDPKIRNYHPIHD